MRSASLKSENEIPFRLGYRRHRQTIPSPQDGHVGELIIGMFAQLLERNEALEFAHQLHIDHEPARIAWIAAGVEVMMPGVEGGLVRIALLHHADDAGNARGVATGV